MLGKFSKGRHVVVGASIGLTTVLAATGVIGGGAHPERFDAKTVVLRPEGDGLWVTEYVDIDFGTERRRGYERLVPNDFGVPADVTASSPDAADDLNVTDFGEYTRIRIGDPDRTFTGQHRYVLDYLLPDARLDEGSLIVDIVSPPGGVYPGDPETGRFIVFIDGVELRNLRCDVGRLGDEGGCELMPIDDEVPGYVAILEPLAEDEGLTVGGEIVRFVEPGRVDVPQLPERRSDPHRGLIALGTLSLGLLGAVPVYRWARQKGRNEVYSGGAADAAYGSLPPPGADELGAPPPVHLVPDEELGDLATIEFVPPKGLAPWEGSVLLSERLGDDVVEAWLSGLVGREAIELDETGSELAIRSGPRRAELDAADAALVAGILDISDPYVTGEYDSKFASAWRGVSRAQRERIAASGWWRHLPPGSGFSRKRSGSPFGLVMLGVFAFFWLGSTATAAVGLLKSWPLAIALALVFPAIVSYFMYRAMLPSRTAQGSALALRTESFRRFLHASEGRHVEWAWSKGLLREYSAWAVALGEAEAWSDALEGANVPAAAAVASGPIILHRHRSSMNQARTKPSSSGGGGRFGGGGGGFGGGGVGGGGGGGSSGSW